MLLHLAYLTSAPRLHPPAGQLLPWLQCGVLPHLQGKLALTACCRSSYATLPRLLPHVVTPARRSCIPSKPAARSLNFVQNLPSHRFLPTHTQVVTNSIAGETYVLSQCGAQVPPADQFPAGTKFFTVPLSSLSAPETVPYAFVVRRAERGAACCCSCAIGNAGRWLCMRLP